MNILPIQLKGKTIADCYESDTGTIIIEFTDGTKIRLDFNGYINPKTSGGAEPFIITTV